MLKFDCFFLTDVGNVRMNNEDNFYLNGSYKRAVEDNYLEKSDFLYRGGIFAVCDGMGGEAYGEKASLYAVEILKEYQNKDVIKALDEYISRANTRICEFIEENNGTRSGTTLALLQIYDNKAVCCNIGDSRIYLYRKGKLTQLSEDHTRVAQMIKMGMITAEEAETHRERHVLTQYLGIFPDEFTIVPYTADTIELSENDVFLLCSDGLTDMLTDKEIEAAIKKKASAKECARALKDAALSKGGKDNITVGIIKVDGKKRNIFKR